MTLAYRLHTPADIDRLVEFWSQQSGWDTIDRNSWEKRFYNTPNGNSEIVIAENRADGSIAAQFIFIPSRISCQGRIYEGFRPFAPVIHKKLREQIGFLQMAKYIVGMHNEAIRHFRNRGVTLLHTMPDPRWARLFHFFRGSKVDYFPLYSLPFDGMTGMETDKSITIALSTPANAEINDLWERLSPTLDCCIVRNAETLMWKLSHKQYRIVALYHGVRLAGLSASIFKPEDKQWLICDVLAENNSGAFEQILKATSFHAQSFRQSLTEPERSSCQKIAILATRHMEEPLKRLGFREEKYKFPLLVQMLDRHMDHGSLHPGNWYVSAND